MGYCEAKKHSGKSIKEMDADSVCFYHTVLSLLLQGDLFKTRRKGNTGEVDAMVVSFVGSEGNRFHSTLVDNEAQNVRSRIVANRIKRKFGTRHILQI